jgi:uncharacterized membrane protein YozB (DUF420 family)
MDAPGFLGTGATLKSDLSLLAYLLLIVPAMLTGFVFARRKMFVPHHKLTMTAIIIVNWVIIFFLMAVSYREGVIPYLDDAPGDPRVALPMIHLVTGAVAQFLGTYLVLRMWFEKVLPKWIMVRKIKTYMRFTLALWLITAALGVMIYATWYVRPVRAGDAPAPVTTPDVTPEAEAETAASLINAPVQTEEVSNPTEEPCPTGIPDSDATEEPCIPPVATEEILPLATEDPCPQETPEINGTEEILATEEVDADATAEPTPPAATEEPCLYPLATEDLRPVATEDLRPAGTPETGPVATEDIRPVQTEEMDDDSDSDDDGDIDDSDDSGGDDDAGDIDDSGGDDDKGN